MKLADLLKEFNVVIDTSEGLNELRTLILGLAVRGKLVPQDPNDEPVSKLLDKIEAEKLNLYEEDFIRKPKKLKPVSEDELLFSIPVSWKWVRLNSLTSYIQRGKSPKYQEGSGLIVINQKCVRWHGIELKHAKEIDPKSLESHEEKRFIQSGDILWNSTGTGTIGRLAIASENQTGFTVDSHVTLVRPSHVLPKYIWCWLAGKEVYGEIENDASGSTNQIELTKAYALDLPTPLPPLKEQHRIVQKIESLFAEVDELEEKLKRQTKLDEKLQMAVNANVQQATDAEASKSAWNFITSNFDTLYHTMEAIDNLKKNILNEAVRGRLVPQNPNDEKASEILNKIEVEKERLYEEGEIRKPKKLPPVKEDEIPFVIPENWEWTNFNEAGVINPRNNAKDDLETSFISMSLISEEYLEMHESETRQWKEIKSGYTHFAENDVGLAKITPCFQNGKAAIFRGLKNGIGAGTTELFVFRSIIDGLIPEYVYAFLKTSMYISNGVSKMTGTAGHQRVPRDYFETTPFPLPPTYEQHRIVRRIEELFAICDRFKAQLEQREKVNGRLVKGLVGEVLEGS